MSAPERFFVDFTFAGQTYSIWLDNTPTEPQELLEDLASVTHAVTGGLVGDAALKIDVERDYRDDPCPECRDGEVEPVGRMERETGHQPYVCNASCGYGG